MHVTRVTTIYIRYCDVVIFSFLNDKINNNLAAATTE